MKVYLVLEHGGDGEPDAFVGVFTSHDGAYKYIQDCQLRYGYVQEEEVHE